MPNYNQYEIVICTGKRRELWEDNLINSVTEFAKANKLGMWAMTFQYPWDFRKAS